MELSQEAHHLIVRYVGTRRDLVNLCRVSKRFQQEAEKALYDTLHLRGHSRTIEICQLLASTPRLSSLVDALSIFVVDDGSDDEDAPVPDDYWDSIAGALQHTTRLRFLSVYFEQAEDTSQAWVLNQCTFQLQTFHCDFEWDDHLLTFLHSQSNLTDLHLADYRSNASTAPSNDMPLLPKLSILECTFSEAAMALSPGRPITRVKTCFSHSQIDEKRTELHDLLTKLRQSRRSLRALDMADEAYTEEFSLELLTSMVEMFSHSSNLRYFGTLVLPVETKQRLEFYATLMRLHRLQCVELEVSEWDPPPMTPAALRALTFELRIYCPTVSRVIFVYDFDRVVMKVTNNICVLDHEASADILWREV
ncbi:hypothetical protein PHLCEN_2v13229 [Hermanssonia centrifuga]|uniref:F-box domain-containing protein n=1 Tax=Hermanssonia centrifuga TaxID=98765 RepID=A0A2R6NEV8_9APHY|nr:hypothetical protein PHLCEN_2v13229 [Hermanssonia centrifuga]